tara:strand:+ start:461 stop:685 length:225 start_codon:yes stop_codon:yes gene_type:complete
MDNENLVLEWADGTLTKKLRGKIITMRTQKTDLKAQIKELEKELMFATVNKDAFTQIALYKKLDKAKTLLINIE